MCGIYGSPTLTPSIRRMLPYLGIAMEDRGKDAWGASNGSTIVKHVGPLTESWDKEDAEFDTWTTGIFHTRGASQGSAKSQSNAHPFSYNKADGSAVIGIHNGMLSNHGELNSKYKRQCEVDSMHIWMHRAEGKSWNELRGWGNLAWYENDEHGVQRMHLARFNSDNIAMVQLAGGELLFASTIQPLRTITRMMRNPIVREINIEEGYDYVFAPGEEDPNKLVLWRGEKLPFANYGTTTVYRGPATYMGGSYAAGYTEPCAKCTHGKCAKDMLVCFQCFGELVTGFLQSSDEERLKGIGLPAAAGGAD